MASKNALDDLLVDEQALNEKLLKELLVPYVQIGSESGDFIPSDEFGTLDSIQQTAIVLLYQTAAYRLELTEKESLTPSTISEVSGLNHNTVKTTVRNLDKDGLVINNDGRYSIPTYAYESIRELIKDE